MIGVKSRTGGSVLRLLRAVSPDVSVGAPTSTVLSECRGIVVVHLVCPDAPFQNIILKSESRMILVGP